MSKRAETCKKRAEKSSERLNMVLDEIFHGDKKLMAFICGTQLVSLYGWLSGKRAPNGMAMFRLSQCVPKYNDLWLGGMTDENRPHETEYWEMLPVEQQHNIFRLDTVLKRKLIANHARIYEYRKKVGAAE